MAKKPTPAVRYRDSVDGQFVTLKEADKRPREIEKEAVKPKPRGKK
jgi:hypothetical protein